MSISLQNVTMVVKMWRIRFMEHVACMASFDHGIAALPRRKPASTVTSYESRDAEDVTKILSLCVYRL